MPDLHSRIAVEIERRLAVARAATPGPWRHDPAKQWHAPEDLAERRNGEEFVGAGKPTIAIAATGPADHSQSMMDADHIALHDPADAERRYSAALRVLNRHAPAPRLTDPLRGEVDPWDLADCAHCDEALPCRDLRDLAASLGLSSAATSPDFRDADGELNEAAYVRYALNVMRRVHAEVAAAAESRGRTAGYTEAVANTRDEDLYRRWVVANAVAPAGARTNVPMVHRDVIGDFLEWVGPSATTEEPQSREGR